ncbi:GNAT family N-acetyltransferase [Cohnella lubricantis]|uniref:GNAT family N-acetyltransferase n=1 Tax=Cohnella lubricantis TaxID=2163172 RepID=A0A841TFP2_9BACL|nr:GNAT family N-acetyltransferase [Cohnella lubricantis]MBB6677767.1 GNAT family N-acetyltransferase [Cohnella lubricantis]MBP2118087.1 ribosomal protein S18 acetylase RimI-like enzyme [Cohnella lubricantis]
MNIVKADLNDLDSLMRLYQAAMNHLIHNGIDQWDEEYPDRETLREDLEAGCLFGIVGGDSRYIGAIVMNEEEDTDYSAIPWEDARGKVLYLHRLVVHPDRQGQGIGRTLLQFAEATAANNGYSSIRLDAYSANPIALNLYERYGYSRRGDVFFPKRERPFNCYEKLLK